MMVVALWHCLSGIMLLVWLFAESAVEQQASAVRELKEGQGLGNEDEAVKARRSQPLGRRCLIKASL